MSYTRFAIYYTPPRGALADFGAWWLGWDVRTGGEVDRQAGDRPVPEGLDAVTETPRKYGFHGTLKPPFRLAEGTDPDGLAAAVADLAARTARAEADGLRLQRIGSFLALVPDGPEGEIARVAAACVTELDRFRAPAGGAELTRRRAAGLSPRQEEMLQAWGYPYVLEEFHFHLTLTGRLKGAERTHWQQVATTALPPLPRPFALDAITLVGERADGRFEEVARYPLKGDRAG